MAGEKMGCVFGKAARPVGRDAGEFAAEVAKEAEAVSQVAAAVTQNGDGNRKENEAAAAESAKPKGERKRSSRPNPRLSNPPKNLHGEQVAAGWPSWLSAVAGEAINGWTPRRADTFEKLDKVRKEACSEFRLMVSFQRWYGFEVQ